MSDIAARDDARVPEAAVPAHAPIPAEAAVPAHAPIPAEAAVPARAPVAVEGQHAAVRGEPATGPVATLAGVSKRFGDLVAIENLSLDVEPGTLLGVIGPSGAGKTTTVRILTGAITPDAGTARVFGEDPSRLRRANRERIGYMPQLFTLYPDLTARENVDYVASLFGLLPRRRWRRTEAALRMVDLWGARSTRASNLSGGMQRRLELACALVHEPELVFLDEPTTGLDPLLRMAVWDELHKLRDLGRTLLVTTQYVTDAEQCDRVVLIADGRLVADGTPEGLRRQAAGGEVMDLETAGPIDPALLSGVPGVMAARSTGYRSVRLTVDSASEAGPAVVEALRASGGEVTQLEEVRPTFDEVFAMLVAQARRDTEGAAA